MKLFIKLSLLSSVLASNVTVNSTEDEVVLDSNSTSTESPSTESPPEDNPTSTGSSGESMNNDPTSTGSSGGSSGGHSQNDPTSTGAAGEMDSGNTTASSDQTDETTAAPEVKVTAVSVASSATITQDLSAATCASAVPVLQMGPLSSCLGMTNATKQLPGVTTVGVCGTDGLADGEKACIKNMQTDSGVSGQSYGYLSSVIAHAASGGCLFTCSSRRERQLDVRGRQLTGSLTVASEHQIQTDPASVDNAALDNVAAAAKASVESGAAFMAVQTAIDSGSGLDIPIAVGDTVPLTVDEVFAASTGCSGAACDTFKEAVSANNMTAPTIAVTAGAAGEVTISGTTSSSTSSTSTTSGAMGQGVTFTAFAVGMVAIFA